MKRTTTTITPRPTPVHTHGFLSSGFPCTIESDTDPSPGVITSLFGADGSVISFTLSPSTDATGTSSANGGSPLRSRSSCSRNFAAAAICSAVAFAISASNAAFSTLRFAFSSAAIRSSSAFFFAAASFAARIGASSASFSASAMRFISASLAALRAADFSGVQPTSACIAGGRKSKSISAVPSLCVTVTASARTFFTTTPLNVPSGVVMSMALPAAAKKTSSERVRRIAFIPAKIQASIMKAHIFSPVEKPRQRPTSTIRCMRAPRSGVAMSRRAFKSAPDLRRANRLTSNF